MAKKPKATPFKRSRRIEARYASQLRKVAREIGRIVSGYPAGDPTAAAKLQRTLEKYSEVLEPWARSVAWSMLTESARQDERLWSQATKHMSKAMREEIRKAPIGKELQRCLEDQVKLIKSLPTEAGQRVHRLTLEGLEQGTRAKEIAAEILRTEDVTKSRAMLIARTEVSRTSSELTQVRAQHVGSEGYIWRTSDDADVRDSHKRMAGRFVSWDKPPTLDGLVGHAGCLPNCRCYPEPVIPEE